MKKIIAAFDGLDFSQSTLDYTLFLASQTKAHVVGVFLDDLLYHSYGYKEMVTYATGEIDQVVGKWNEQDQEKRNESVMTFEKACQEQGINYSVHRDRNVALQELLHESIYSDLLIINWNETFTHLEQKSPSMFLRDLLSDVQCPVLLVPDKFYPLERLVLLYDGGPVSVYAIKMFSYLLPVLKQLETDVISVKPEDDNLHMPDNRLMKEFMKRHFPNAEYNVLKGLAEDKIISFLQAKKNHALIVLGAYRRSRVSRWFKPSMADSLMRYLNQPLFIAHNK